MHPQTRDEGRCSLAAEALRSWGTLKLRATGISMLPTLWPGDLLTVQSFRSEQARIGEIVLYMRQDRFFVHRVVSADLTRDDSFLITRGDCMSESDPPVRKNELLGRVTEVERANSVFVPARTRSPFRRFEARMLCRWSLLRRIALRLRSCRQAHVCSSESSVVHGFSRQASAGNGAIGN